MAESHPVGAPLEAQEPQIESESDNEDQEQVQEQQPDTIEGSSTAKPKKKKKKSKKSKLVNALTGNKADKSTEPGEASTPKSAPKLDDATIKTLLDVNPSLKGELAGLPPEKAQEVLKKLNVTDLLTGMSINGKNQKDMASYKFWSTQPVVRFDEKSDAEKPDGPIKPVIAELVPKEAAPLPEGYEWVELDLNNDTEVKEVYNLLSLHYVEDDHAMFRFNYSAVFLDWALKSPDFKKSWHIGVRAKGASRVLVATIFGIPIKLRIRENVLDVVEINFMCVHKKLRSKRLAPVLIKEVTRRCHLVGVYQAIYTGGAILPTPVGSARYYHRSLDWLKLYEVGFSPLPPNSTQAKMIVRNQLPTTTSTKGLRQMEEKDLDGVHDLLTRYLNRFELVQEFTKEEIKHWFYNSQKPEEQVVWSFVAEDPETGKITDFGSFYCLESSVIGDMSKKHEKIRAAYLYYYATEHAFNPKEKGLKERLLVLINDLLIEAKKAKFDVFNALTLHDNPLFLEQLKFGAGDGSLHHYLYNWRTKPINAGVDARNRPDENKRGGIGIVLL